VDKLWKIGSPTGAHVRRQADERVSENFDGRENTSTFLPVFYLSAHGDRMLRPCEGIPRERRLANRAVDNRGGAEPIGGRTSPRSGVL